MVTVEVNGMFVRLGVPPAAVIADPPGGVSKVHPTLLVKLDVQP